MPGQAELKLDYKGIIMAQNPREYNETKARKWIHNTLTPAFQHWARSCIAGEPEDIKPTATKPNPLGKTLEWRQKPVSPACVKFGIEPELLVMYSYTIRLEVSPQSVIGNIEFGVEGEVKYPITEEPDILSWDKEKIRQDMMDRMCRI